MSGRRRRIRIALYLSVGIVAPAIALGAYGINMLRSLELHTVDARFALRGSHGSPRDLVVVQIDDVTFDDLKQDVVTS